MRKIIEEHFFKSIPLGKEKSVIEEIDQFIFEYETNGYDIRKVSKGYYVRKIEGAKNQIFKIRINIKDRVLFTFASNVDEIRLEFSKAIIFLDYCNHDRQIVKGRKINLKSNYNNFEYIDEEKWDNFIEEAYVDFEYKPEKIIARVVNNMTLAEMYKGDNENVLYYLSEEQNKCLDIKLSPLLLMGSAGSGKTTIGLYKLFLLCENDIDIAYFTYSRYLSDESKKMFKTICEDEKIGLYDKYCEKVNFSWLNKYLLENSLKSNTVKFPEFDDWFKNKLQRNGKFSAIKIDSIDIWKEIRGIIKGIIGIGWIKQFGFSVEGVSSWTYDFLIDNNIIKLDNDKIFITEGLPTILKLLSFYKGEKKDFISIEIKELFQILNGKVYNEGMLKREEYLELPMEYCIFNKEDREIIYDIAEKYDAWLQYEKKVDENDITRVILKKIDKGLIKKYDFIMVDEIQDLTEIQIFLLYSLLKNKNNVFLSGDFNQTINPTFFSTFRIESLFCQHNESKKFNKKCLRVNYRSSKDITELAKQLSILRIEKLSKSKNNDYEETAFRENTEKPYLLRCNERNENLLIETAIKRHYVAIVVPDVVEKQRIETLIGRENTVFTVEEIKGIEKKYIICYNVISRYREKWNEIFENTYSNASMYRYYFNLLYVAITRARDYLCFYEEDINEYLLEYIKDYITIVDEFNEESLNLHDISTENDFYKEGLKYEEMGAYSQAIEQYKNTSIKAAKIGIKRCQAMILNNKGLYLAAGNKLMKIEEYEKAGECYKEGKNFENYIKSLVYMKNNYNVIKNKLKTYDIEPANYIYDIKTPIPWIEEFDSIYMDYLNTSFTKFKDNMDKAINTSKTLVELTENKNLYEEVIN